MANLHETARIEGKSAALIHVSQDQTVVNLIIFTIPRITISADVVEFTE
jgi:hypothetical protein